LLMLGEDLFVLGLAAFLLAHLAYIGGFLVASHGSSATGGVFSSVFVPVTALTLGFRIARQLLAGPHRELFVPVVAYMVVIAGMVGAACATGNVVAAAAAVTFYASDATIAEQRFVQARRWQPVAIMVTYHVAQTLFVLSLLR